MIVLEWHFTGSMAYARASHTSSLLTNGKVLVIGGFCYSNQDNARMPDPSTDNRLNTTVSKTSRTLRRAFISTIEHMLDIRRQNSDAVSLNSVELYDPSTGNWTITGNLSIPRADHTASVLNDGRVLVTGGVSPGSEKNAGNSAELYDPSTGRWVTQGNMTYARNSHTASVLTNGKVLVAGGSGSDGTSDSAELYDPSTGNWTLTGKLTTGRALHTAIVLTDGKVLITGGTDYTSALQSTELYDPSTGVWTSTGALKTARGYHTACLLTDGRVLVTGGAFDSLGVVISASTELYNSSTGNWSTTGDLNVPTMSPTSSLLHDGKVLVVGGQLYETEILKSAQLYDPSTGDWTLVASLENARFLHAETVLINGKVLVTGGFGDYIQRAAELYDPLAERA